MKLYSTYPYLIISLVLFALFFLCFLIAKKQRKPMFLSALLSAPFGFLSVFFIPAYWQPIRIGEWGGAGIEDIIFSFSNGGIVWFLVTWPIRTRLSVDIQIKRMLRRYLTFSILGISFGLILLFLGFDPMHGTLLGIAIMAIILLQMRRKLWLLPVIGAICFGLTYTIMCSVVFALNPDFLLQWNLKTLSWGYYLGVPLEEIIWSIAFGAVWPLLVAYSFDTQIEPQKTPTGKNLF